MQKATKNFDMAGKADKMPGDMGKKEEKNTKQPNNQTTKQPNNQTTKCYLLIISNSFIRLLGSVQLKAGSPIAVFIIL